MFLNKIGNIFCVPDTKFVSATNVARAGKPGNICVGNNVSATMCPRLPEPLYPGAGLITRYMFFATDRWSFDRCEPKFRVRVFRVWEDSPQLKLLSLNLRHRIKKILHFTYVF